MNKKVFFMAALAASVSVFSGCSDDDNPKKSPGGAVAGVYEGALTMDDVPVDTFDVTAEYVSDSVVNLKLNAKILIYEINITNCQTSVIQDTVKGEGYYTLAGQTAISDFELMPGVAQSAIPSLPITIEGTAAVLGVQGVSAKGINLTIVVGNAALTELTNGQFPRTVKYNGLEK